MRGMYKQLIPGLCMQLLPTEVALEVFSYLPYQSLLTCALVCRRWRVLADDQSLWKNLCLERRWEWRVRPVDAPKNESGSPSNEPNDSDLDDEGMGDEEDDDLMQVDDSGFASSMDVNEDDTVRLPLPSASASTTAHLSLLINTGHTLPNLLAGPSRASNKLPSPRKRHSAPSILHTPAAKKLVTAPAPSPDPKPNYKLLHQTHVKLRNRFTTGQYTLSNLQTRGAPNGHTNTIYCLQLYTYPATGVQVLFTGSKDRTIREWDLQSGAVLRVLEGVSGAVYRCVEELTRVRSVLPPRPRGDAGAGARREQPTAASSEPSSTSSAGTAGREEAPSVANGNGKAVDVGAASSEEERSSSETESDEFEVEGGFVVR